MGESETLQLERLLVAVEGAASAEARTAAVEHIKARYTQHRTILVGDMEGFTRRVARDGIVPFIASIYRLRRLAAPLVTAADGYLFKAEADNLFVAFSEPAAAVRSAIALQRAIIVDNRLRSEVDRIGLSIGIASGDVLAIGVEDVWGHAINVASKLGEDVGRGSEILVDDDSFRAADLEPSSDLLIDAHHVDISGVNLGYHRIVVRG